MILRLPGCRLRVLGFLAWCVALVQLPQACGQENWPRFLGPNGVAVAHAEAIPTEWRTADYKWRVKLPGIGHSSPVVWGKRIFITAALEEDATQIIRCLRSSDGGLIWKRDFHSQTHRKHSFNCYASATPALDAERVYMAWANPESFIIVALDQRTGSVVWQRDLGPFKAQHGFGASPVVYGNLLIVPNEQDGPSSIVALDCRTGAVRWTTPRNAVKAAYSTPTIFQPENGPPQLITTSMAHGVSGIDPSTGKLLWELPVFRYRVVGSPSVAAGLIFATCGEGGVGRQMVAVRPGNPATGRQAELVYELQKYLPYVCTSVAHGELLFALFDQGALTCVEAATGKIVWQEKLSARFFSSPLRVDDRLYCISRDGKMFVFAAARQYQLLATIDLEEPSFATPAVADGVMYIRTQSHLMALDGAGRTASQAAQNASAAASR